MAPKKAKGQTKKKINTDETASDHSLDEIPLSQNTQCSQRSRRAKRYSKDESNMLVKVCADFHSIISQNSNRDADVEKKAKVWEMIKRKFDACCRAEAIYVSIFIGNKIFMFRIVPNVTNFPIFWIHFTIQLTIE